MLDLHQRKSIPVVVRVILCQPGQLSVTNRNSSGISRCTGIGDNWIQFMRLDLIEKGGVNFEDVQLAAMIIEAINGDTGKHPPGTVVFKDCCIGAGAALQNSLVERPTEREINCLPDLDLPALSRFRDHVDVVFIGVNEGI